MRTTTRTTLTLLLAGGLALGGCSAGDDDASSAPSPSAPVTTSAAPTTAPTTPAAPTAAPEPTGADPTTAGGPDRCHTSELTGQLTDGDAGAGQRGATLVLTDTGGEVCTVYGFGGLGLVAADGTALPTVQDRLTDPAPRTVTLQPGQSVSAQLRWTAVASGSEPVDGDCEPTAARLAVIPPDETDPLSVPWSGGPVCGGGRISQTAYAPA